MRLIGARLSPGSDTFVAALTTKDGVESARILTSLETFWGSPAAALASYSSEGGTVVPLDQLQVVPPVLPGARVLCIGLNYLDHVLEGSYSDAGLPDYPTIFARWTSSLTVSGAPIPVPSNEDGIDWEGEIAAFIGVPLTDADADTARAAVMGYSAFNDVTSRRAQKLTSQWILGKNGDNSGPLGPLVTSDEVGDLRDGLTVETRVNGTTVQEGNTKHMVYELGEVLSLVSHSFTLNPGDIICTGTPAGVGYSRTPQWLLHPGDVVEVEIERLGTVTNPVVANDFRTQSAQPLSV
ncbi:fumarylacetoacetate hydrolase family protein [Salinibacterium sp. NK8237]|uniref:fumarylacetoacetate hydrolase family protein n=1 Tax=Salinibacterium sp. NK8237 TaxID=2792038 RepID=UPI0018CCF39F|nr:fumarylacetoacetate hydrolase family protein [Salinibacterium sp. NK8237]MBH0130752.1 fumarylacetoacetate hydrolase family protein [Salinibacterium sp. NK8237]